MAPRRTLTVVCVATAMLMLDIAVVNTALSSISENLHPSLTGLEWIVNAYTLSLATVVLSFGSLADRIGRRRLFAIGVTVFGLSSLACGLAPSILALDLARAIQGLGAAMMFATSLALLSATHRGAAPRARAFATLGAVIGATFALGPLVGGALTTWVGWRSIFFLNVPIAAALTVIVGRAVPESSDPNPRPVDMIGQLLMTGGMLLLVLGLLRARSDGWSNPAILAELIAGGCLLVMFAVAERRIRHPMLPPKLFASRRFTAAQLTVFAISASLFAIYLYVTLYLEEIRHLSAIDTGLVYLPLTGAMFISSGAAVRLAPVVPKGVIIGGSLGIVGLGLALLLTLQPRSPWLAAEPGLIIAGLGAGVFNATGSELALSAAPERYAGLASGINDTFRQGAIPLGVAVYGTLVPPGAALGRGDTAAFIAGFHHALIVAAAVALAGAAAGIHLLGARWQSSSTAAVAGPA